MALIFERLYSLQTKLVIPDRLLDEVLSLSQPELLNPNSISQLKNHCAMGEIIVTGLMHRQHKPSTSESDFRAEVEARGRRVNHKL
jgi:hypothetical protein